MSIMERSWWVLVIIFSLCIILPAKNAIAQSEKILEDKKIEGYQVIRLDKYGKEEGSTFVKGRIIPEVAKVKAGTTVIWINESKSYAEIAFTDKKVTLACQNPVHFVVDENGAFVSNLIPFGAVASLCFIEKGEFDYAMTMKPTRRSVEPYYGKPQIAKGKVIVE